MANSTSNITYRPVSTSQTPPSIDDDQQKTSIPKPKFAVNIQVSFSCPLNIPPTPEVAASRTLRNLSSFKLFYVIFILVVLFITLIPRRELSLLLLLVTSDFGVIYLLMLRAFPTSVVLHRLIDKRLIFGLFAVAIVVEMIVTDAGLHLLFTLVGTVPVILIHAVLQATEGFCVTGEADAGNHILDAAV